MRIGVLSDTHIPKAALDLPEDIYNEFVTVDLILHAGDLVELSVLEKLEKMAPVKAVYGNMDMTEVRQRLPKKEIIEIGDFKIGLMHGFGTPKGLEKRVKGEFDKSVDLIVFGHSHMPFNEKIDNTILFNPGSPTDKIFTPYNSFGILDIGDEIVGRILRI